MGHANDPEYEASAESGSLLRQSRADEIQVRTSRAEAFTRLAYRFSDIDNAARARPHSAGGGPFVDFDEAALIEWQGTRRIAELPIFSDSFRRPSRSVPWLR
jgi:hypothetical protein